MRNKIIALSIVALAMGILGIAGRIFLVHEGILFGNAAVSRIDRIVASLLGLGTAGAATVLARRHAEQIAKKTGPTTGQSTYSAKDTFVDRAAALTALGTIVTLLVSTVTLFSPIERAGLSQPSCPGSHSLSASYIGITAGPDGNNSRSGPARYYPANGRFSKGCSLGFSSYCVGDPIVDQSSLTDRQTWVTSRWLLLAKQPAGWRSLLARRLSGEDPERQFVSDANVTPATNYENLKLAPASTCSNSYHSPLKAVLSTFDAGQQTFTAVAAHAANIGFAVWIPPGQGFTSQDFYEQIFSDKFAADRNPGATSADGSKTVAWTYHESLLNQLNPNRAGGATSPAYVVVMAIPCISDNIPAEADTAAVATYDIASAVNPRLHEPGLTGYDPRTLARAACQANT